MKEKDLENLTEEEKKKLEEKEKNDRLLWQYVESMYFQQHPRTNDIYNFINRTSDDEEEKSKGR